MLSVFAMVLELPTVCESARTLAPRAPQEKKDKRLRENYIFSLHVHIVTGNGGLWQVSEAPKYFGGGVKKRNKIIPPPHSDR